VETAADSRKEAPSVVYDGQCPFCRAYVASLDVKPGSQQRGLNKIDARHSPQRVRELSDSGIDVNAGIVLIKGDARYQGAEALSMLARHHADGPWWSGLHHRLLRHRALSQLLYPLLRALRNSYLQLLARQPINTKQDNGEDVSQQGH